MKRLHVHMSVADLDQSIRFYSSLFAAPPTVRKADYAKWMLEDPRVNFAISTQSGTAAGIDHLGLQVEDGSELDEVYGRFKHWIADPQGVSWETFLTTGESTVYGTGAPKLEVVRTAAKEGSCCGPSA
jgi:catechol 2,3-dioxygenase-like lactoylglutathione lyase family enzyme